VERPAAERSKGVPPSTQHVQASETGAELLFQVLAERNEVASVVATTNLPFGEWTRIFTDTRLCKAVVDRLTFGAHIIETGTDSWRLRRSLDRARKDRDKDPKP
jgi:DNA replication protein DnaC